MGASNTITRKQKENKRQKILVIISYKSMIEINLKMNMEIISLKLKYECRYTRVK